MGAESGKIFAFDGATDLTEPPVMARSVVAHIGPVTCVHATDICLLSGGADGMVRRLRRQGAWQRSRAGEVVDA